ncbi:MAG: hypothetical protein IJB28_03410 [Bacteroidaceae bacterium]|nr:hypothetical protein [Bacteroidaceae bacterium]MBQ6799773.1 hypothetical protein [Bacteroidaceae bacterium]
MNKKFLSAILFGALTAASTSTFVSCKDYDDDIDQLQMQIDQNASSAASDLAAKVTALESQISTLNAAKQDLTSQLAAAKTEAANAAAAALEAAKGAQSGADAANKALAEAAAKVAVLETKVASLEGIVADLQTAKADLNAKVSDLQTQMAAVKADTKSNADAIAAANAEILAKYSELSGKISEVSTALGARIDVVDATLNTIKANYATKDELNTKAAELAAMDAQLNAQIATNLKYIETLQATVKDLAAKDAELAGKIEANYAELLGKINTMATEQAAALKDIQALQATVATLNSSYSTLSSAKADVTYVNEVKEGLTKLVEQLSTSTNTYSQYIEDLRDRVSKLEQGAADLQKKVDAAATQEALNAAIEDLKSQIKEAGVASDATLAEAIEAVEASVAANAEEIAAIKETLASKADQSALDDLAASLGITQADVMTISLNLKALQAQIADQKAELEGKIAAAEESAKDYAYDLILKLTDLVNANTGNIATNTDAIAALQAAIEDLSDMANGSLSDFVTSAEQADAIDDLYNGISAELDDYVAIVDLKRLYADREELDAKLATLNEELNTWKEGFKTEYEGMKQELKGEIDALKGLNADLVAVKDAVKVLQDRVNAIINSVQSVVFVPEYRGTTADVYTSYLPQFAQNDKKKWVETTSLFFNSTIKFRVQPAGVAKKLAEAWAENKGIIKLESADALKDQTRAAKQYMTVQGVAAEGDYLLVDAQNSCKTEDLIPTTLVITNAVNDSTVLAKTSDYFNVQSSSIQDYSKVALSADTEGLNHVGYKAGDVAWVNVNAGNATVTIDNTYFEAYPYAKYSTAIAPSNPNGKLSFNSPESNIVKVSKDFKNDYFVVDKDGVKVLPAKDGTANPAAVGQSVVVTLADAAYGFNQNGDYNVQYNVTYIIEKDVCDLAYTIPAFNIKWDGTSAKPQTITVETIATEADDLATYKQTAQGVFDLLFNAILGGENVMTGDNGCSATLAADPKTKSITVTPVVDVNTANYVNTKNTIKHTFVLGQNGIISLTLVGSIDLTIPGEEEFFIKREQYWNGTGNINVRVNYNVKDLDPSTPYVYTLNMEEVYSNIEYWKKGKSVAHNWTIDQYKEGNVAYNVASGISLVNGVLTVNGPIAFNNAKDGKEWKDKDGNLVYRTANDLTFTAKATMGKTTLATNKVQGFHVTFPTEGVSLQVPTDGVVRKASEFAGSSVYVAEGVSYTDRDTHKWIVKGKFDPAREWETTWGYTNLKYEVVSAKVVSTGTDITKDFAPEFVDPTVGELTIQNAHNLTKDIEIEVKVSFDYNYQIGISNTFKVTVKAE